MKNIITILTFLILFNKSNAQNRFTCSSNDSINQGLVFCLPFNGNAFDQSGNGYNGTVFGSSLIEDRFGNLNSAYNFNGTSNYIDLAKNLPDQSELSMSIWIKPNGNVTGALPGFIFFEGDANCGKDFIFGYKNGELYVCANKGNATLNSLGTSPVIPVNSNLFNHWYHIVLTITNTQTKVFVNGILISTINESASFIGNHFIPTIGCGFDGGGAPCGSPRGKFFSGGIDDIRFYNRVLSNMEVTKLYTVENPGDTMSINSGLVFSFPFSGNAIDSSGNQYNGTVFGATLANDRFGKSNSSYLFNGTSNYIDLAKNLPDLNKFSLSVWVKPTGNSTGDGTIFFEGDSYCANDIFLLYQNNKLFVGSNKNGATLNSTGSSPSIPVAPGLFNNWYHIVWSMNGNESNVYINDSLIKTISELGSGIGNHFTPTIGSVFDGGLAPCGSPRSRFFQGNIDDIRYYSRGLNAREVHELYTLPGNQTGLVKNLKSQFHIYPNPSTGIINVNLNEPVILEVFDFSGRILLVENKYDGISEINLSDFPNGIYFLNFRSGDEQLFKRVIIQH